MNDLNNSSKYGPKDGSKDVEAPASTTSAPKDVSKDVEAPASTFRMPAGTHKSGDLRVHTDSTTTNPPFNASIIFFILLTAAALSYHYNAIIFSPPQSIHRWRQTDGASVALNYYQHGMRFFKPETHALTSDGGTTGYSAGEFPLLYYFMASLYKIFGPHDSVFRISNMLLFFSGLYALFRLSWHLTKDIFHAGVIPVMIFTSPVSAYYGCNFLPDTAALALTFWGWLFYIKNENNSINKELNPGKTAVISREIPRVLLPVLFFTLAGLLKVTMSISLVTVLLIKLYRCLNPEKSKSTGLATIFPAIGLLLISAWYIYAINYNKIHESNTFLTSIRPWWLFDKPSRKELTAFILERNFHLYFSKSIMAFLSLCLIIVIIKGRTLLSGYYAVVMLMVTGSFFYINLWYAQFQYHDYYFIVVLSSLGLMLAGAMSVIKKAYPGIFNSVIFKAALIALIVFNVIHAREEVSLRYYGWKREAPVFEEYFDIKPYLETINIKSDDRVISIPDGTNCYTLYMMNRAGNNLPGINKYTGDAIKLYRSLGAKYPFVNDTALLSDPVLKEFTTIEAGRKGNVRIFMLLTKP